MPLIEELPVASTIKASHGWAYVPDTGPIAAQQPGTRDRKRAAAVSSKHAVSTTAKQQKAIQQRLDSLNKENYKDGVTVPIPARIGASARERAGRKMTANVRRILTYQRGFAHYLADEEANNPGGIHYQIPNVASAMGPPPAPSPAVFQDAKAPKASTKESRRRSGARMRSTANDTSAPTTPTPPSQPRGRKRGRPASRAKSIVEEAELPPDTRSATEEPVQVKSEDGDTAMPDADIVHIDSAPTQALPQPDYPPEWDHDPLLATTVDEVPRMPSDKVMQMLISEPPLTYNAARATPLDVDKQRPPRHFCGICGYWGKVRCKKCEEWTCGIMECWKGHEAVCAMANLY